MPIDIGTYRDFASIKDGRFFKKKVNIDNKTLQPVIHGFFGRLVRFLSVPKRKREELNKKSLNMFINAIYESFGRKAGKEIEHQMTIKLRLQQGKTLCLYEINAMINHAEKYYKRIDERKILMEAEKMSSEQLKPRSTSLRKYLSVDDIRKDQLRRKLLDDQKQKSSVDLFNLFNEQRGFPSAKTSNEQTKGSFSEPFTQSGLQDCTNRSSEIKSFSANTNDLIVQLSSVESTKDSNFSQNKDNLAITQSIKSPTSDKSLKENIYVLKEQESHVLNKEVLKHEKQPETLCIEKPDDQISQLSESHSPNTPNKDTGTISDVEKDVVDENSRQVAEFCDKILGVGTFQSIVHRFKTEPEIKQLMENYEINDAEAVSIRFCAIANPGTAKIDQTISQQRFNRAINDKSNKDTGMYPMIECALRGLDKLPDDKQTRYKIIDNVKIKQDYRLRWKDKTLPPITFITLPDTTAQEAKKSSQLILKYEIDGPFCKDVSKFCSTEVNIHKKTYLLLPKQKSLPMSMERNKAGGICITYNVTDSRNL